jgi:uncharacterized protein (TIGR00730 family)
MTSICVYCGSRTGHDPRFIEAARRLGTLIGEQGCRLVYGGGHAGLMGAVADAALQAGAQVLGIIPRRLVARELGHRGIQELRVVDTMHDRKLQMAAAADAFIALPGGLGTLEELFEAWTWQQLGYHARPIGLLDTAGYFAPLRAMAEQAVSAGFVDASTIARLRVESDPQRLLARLLGDAAASPGGSDFSPI